VKEQQTIYFDSNVYGHIAEVNEAEKIKHFLMNNNIRLLLSQTILMEVIRISDRGIREKRATTVSTLCNFFYQRSNSYYLAKEIISEISKHRVGWLKKNPDLSTIKYLNSYWKRRWKNIQKNNWHTLYKGSPGFEDIVFDVVGKNKEIQKKIREVNPLLDNVVVEHPNPTISKIINSISDNIEKCFRSQYAIMWFRALNGEPNLRDLNDWVAPYFNINKVDRDDWTMFWVRDLDIECVPLNYIDGTVVFFQPRTRVTAGNPFDVDHAANLLKCDIFFTADKGFYEVLEETKKYLMNKGFTIDAVIILLDRGKESVLDQLKTIVRELYGKSHQHLQPLGIPDTKN